MTSAATQPDTRPGTTPMQLDSRRNVSNPPEDSAVEASGSATVKKKKKKHRGGKRRNRRQSFAGPSEHATAADASGATPTLLEVPDEGSTRNSFYMLNRGNRSNTSIASEALLDHRDQGPLMTRRQSIQQGIYGGSRSSIPYHHHTTNRSPQRNQFSSPNQSRSKLSRVARISDDEEGSDTAEEEANDRTPLISSIHRGSPPKSGGYGGFLRPGSRRDGENYRGRSVSSGSSRKKTTIFDGSQNPDIPPDYDINNPPSVPPSPVLSPDMGYDDLILTEDISREVSPGRRRRPSLAIHDAVIDIDENGINYSQSTPPTPRLGLGDRRRTMTNPPVEDVCFPLDVMSELAQEDIPARENEEYRPRRRRARHWPDLSVLEDWSREEKEQRTMEGVRARKVSEPLMVGGRLRPQKRVWHRVDDDAPYRFTYFNEEFQSTVHSQTISELVQPGQTFRDLFIPDPPELLDSSSEDEDTRQHRVYESNGSRVKSPSNNSQSRVSARQSLSGEPGKHDSSGELTRASSPTRSQAKGQKPKRYGARPVFWLDVLSPTDAEMRVISKAFGIHPLTAEDIMVQEAREKVELFRHYYFVNYRTFEQDENSEDYLEPVNMYVVVFREGVVSFHFSMTPHPANVRRRIRQLSDYLILSSDWISYAIIDDITDVYAPLIRKIEDEVDDIDDTILELFTTNEKPEPKQKSKPGSRDRDFEKSIDFEGGGNESGSDMLRRVGECRKKVMALYRLLGNKADVIKGLAKRCNEQWEVAPRSEIGLYLGDIQDHIVTMTGNLGHYENLLSRAHSNYLAQVNLQMNDRAERNADVLGKLTVLGTIVLPLNIVTGLFGANFKVPGQDIDSLNYFWATTAGMALFAIACFFIAKKIYGIV